MAARFVRQIIFWDLVHQQTSFEVCLSKTKCIVYIYIYIVFVCIAHVIRSLRRSIQARKRQLNKYRKPHGVWFRAIHTHTSKSVARARTPGWRSCRHWQRHRAAEKVTTVPHSTSGGFLMPGHLLVSCQLVS